MEKMVIGDLIQKMRLRTFKNLMAYRLQELDDDTFNELKKVANNTRFVENTYNVYVGEFNWYIQNSEIILNKLADENKISTYAGETNGIWAWNSQTAESLRDYQSRKGDYYPTGALDQNTYLRLLEDSQIPVDPGPTVPVVKEPEVTSSSFGDFKTIDRTGNINIPGNDDEGPLGLGLVAQVPPETKIDYQLCLGKIPLLK